MIHESMDISVTCHFVVFASFVEEDLPLCIFLILLHIEEGKKDACIIFETLIRSMKEWRLEYDKCVGFRSDGASTTIVKQNGIVARMKEKINHFLTSIQVLQTKYELKTTKHNS